MLFSFTLGSLAISKLLLIHVEVDMAGIRSAKHNDIHCLNYLHDMTYIHNTTMLIS